MEVYFSKNKCFVISVYIL